MEVKKSTAFCYSTFSVGFFFGGFPAMVRLFSNWTQLGFICGVEESLMEVVTWLEAVLAGRTDTEKMAISSGPTDRFWVIFQ